MSELLLPQYSLGYAAEKEDQPSIDNRGEDVHLMLAAMKASVPATDPFLNPAQIVKILDQMRLGSCQGHSLAICFAICYWLVTGQWIDFSRAAAYYLSQRKDGIRGDNGSTLNGGNWVATDHGLCLEAAWRYNGNQYNPAEPPGLTYPFKIKASKVLRSAKEVFEVAEQAIPIQIGVRWNNSCLREIVDAYNPSNTRDGHSTTFWGLVKRGTETDIKNINQWGGKWNGDGVQQWTFQSVDTACRTGQTFIAYYPDMEHPIPDVISAEAVLSA